MTLLGLITVEAIKAVVRKVAGNLIPPASHRSTQTPISPDLRSIQAHMEEVSEWAQQVQFLGMSTPAGLGSTIALDISAEARRFQALTKNRVTRTEIDILTGVGNYLLLGEPGSGKTTTLKRLCHMLFEPPKSEADTFDLPIVVRLRELLEGETLYLRLARALGLPCTQHDVVTRTGSKFTPSGSGSSWGAPSVTHGSTLEVHHMETRIGDRQAEEVIPEVLNKAKALLLLDGLDEVRTEALPGLRRDITRIARRLRTAKIVATCRTGEHSVQIDGLSVMEICPLTLPQITAIAHRWLGKDSNAFLAELEQLPYSDLANRPLLLTQLLFLYRRYGYLPKRSADIYRRVVRLLLEEWDAERGIRRQSRYADFTPDRKADFLAALAYHITYRLRDKTFTEDELVQAYEDIYQPFDLPQSEARAVAKEIQTHTGLVILGPRDRYEFCHLSLQEYLCADYLVRAGTSKKLPGYIAAYAAPLAVSITLSSRPSEWLAAILLEPGNLQALGDKGLHSFLSRLAAERPYFDVYEPLGFVVVRCLHMYWHDANIAAQIATFLLDDAVLESLAKALRWYHVDIRPGSAKGLLTVRLKRGLENPGYNVEPPALGLLPGALLPRLLKYAGRIEYFESPSSHVASMTSEIAAAVAAEAEWPPN